jgi:inner membrane protein
MTGRTHAAIGCAVGILGAAHSPSDTLLRAAVVTVAVIASLIPDIDHPKAIVSGYLPGVGHATRLFVSHRGGTHTVIFAAAIIALLTLIRVPLPLVAAVGAGMLSHLIADMTTPQGVPLLMPLSRRPFMIAPRPVLWATSWIIESVALVGSLVLMFLVIGGKL